MRGPPALHLRGGDRPQPRNEATAQAYTVPAPYGGWNARGNLANMPATDAIQMDNIFPGVQEVELREGRINWVTGFGANIKSLIPYNGKSTSKLFASTNSGIYDATGSGAVGAAVSACTNGAWQSVNFVNAGNSYVILCNGTDAVKSYDGTTWANPAITGVTPADLKYVHSHKRRLWFIEKNSMNLWYLGTDAIAGAATQFPVGGLFKKGGSITAIGSWTIDGGNGPDDYFAIVTSAGEIAVYQGTDPASSTTWTIIGVYEVPRPLGTLPFIDYGGDLLYLSRNGLIPMSKLAQSAVIDRSQLISFKIDGAYLDASALYSGNFGWQVITHRTKNMLFVNVPVSQDTLSYQFVMNTITQSWCRFTNWNASCWAQLGDDLYFAGGTVVSKALQGYNDAGTPIVGTVLQAYNPLGRRGQKEVSLARVNFGISAAVQFTAALDTDFKTFGGQTSINYAPPNTSAVWDSSLWDSGLWDSGTAIIEPKWQTIPGNLGYLHSFRLQITSSTSSFFWTSTDYAYKPAGIL